MERESRGVEEREELSGRGEERGEVNGRGEGRRRGMVAGKK